MGIFRSRYSESDVTYSSLMTLAQSIKALLASGEVGEGELSKYIGILFQIVDETTESTTTSGYTFNSARDLIEMNTKFRAPINFTKVEHKIDTISRLEIASKLSGILESNFQREQIFDLLIPIVGKELGISTLNSSILTPEIITLMIIGFMLATVKGDTERETKKDKEKRRSNASNIASIFLSYSIKI